MRNRVSFLTLSCTLAVTLAVASSANADPLNMWTAGHGDIGFAYEDSAWDPHWHLEGPGVVIGGVTQPPDFDEEFEPDEIWAVVPNSTVRNRDANAAWDDIGVAAGEEFWTLPEHSFGQGGFNSTDLVTPFVGHATEELSPADWVGNAITLQIEEVTSPSGSGTYSLFTGGTLGGLPNFTVSVTDDAGGDIVNPSGDTFVLPAGIHTHFAIGFTEPGHWEVTYRVSGENVVDGFVSDTGTFEFKVVPEPMTASLLGIGGVLLMVGAIGRRRAAKRRS